MNYITKLYVFQYQFKQILSANQKLSEVIAAQGQYNCACGKKKSLHRGAASSQINVQTPTEQSVAGLHCG